MLKVNAVTNKQELNKFISFPDKLYTKLVFENDELMMLDRSKNNDFSNINWSLYLVYNEKKLVGRFALIENKIYNNENNVNELRFTRFDCIEDQEVSKCIFDYIVNYAKEGGYTSIVGPLGFSSFDRNGLLINNYDLDVAYLNNYNFEYYKKYLEDYGFTPYAKLKSFSLDLGFKFDSIIDKICKYNLDKYNLRYEFPNSGKEGVELFQKSFTLLNKINQTYDTDHFFQNFDEKMAKFYTNLLTHFIRENDITKYFICIKDTRNNIVGFCALSSDMSLFSKKSLGKTDLITYVRLTRPTEIVDLVCMYVDREYQNCELEGVMLYQLLHKLAENGVKKICTRAILESTFDRFIIRDHEFKEDHEYAVYRYVL